jgi:hypothetical protein
MCFEGFQLTDRGNWLPADETDDLTAGKANGTAASLMNAILRLCCNRRAPETETFRISAASLTVRSSDSTDLSSVDWSIDRRFCQRIVFRFLLLASLFGLAISFNISSKAFAQSSPSGNCNMQLGGAVTFCEPFDVVNPGIPSRTGALDPSVWGVSRTTGNFNFGVGQYNGWAATEQLLTCNGTTTVTPPNDITICNGQLREVTSDNPTGAQDAGNVTTLAMYPKQPFDFAGRTGTVSFDVSNDSHGTHSAWPEFWMSDLPVPAPFNHFDSWQALPQNGFGIRFAASVGSGSWGSCQNGNNLNEPRWTVDSAVVVRNYVMDDTNGLGGVRTNMAVQQLDCVIAPPDNLGVMNHIEIQVNQNEIDVYATDAGVAASPTTLRKIASITNANLTLTRGLR